MHTVHPPSAFSKIYILLVILTNYSIVTELALDKFIENRVGTVLPVVS